MKRRRGVARMAALCVLLLPSAGRAIDRSLCADDGVTEVPPFARGRDEQQCLMIDPGNGAPPVPFQYEFFHLTGIARSAHDKGEGPIFDRWIENTLDPWGRCRTKEKGEFCSLLIWDTTFDNYLSPVGMNDDIMTNSGQALEYMYFKNSKILNGWKCSGKEWKGPNGISCPAEKSRAHSDGIQMRGTLANGGWLIFQDSALVNGHTALLRLQNKKTSYEVRGNYLFQGFQLGTVNTPIGQSEHWIDDCYARGAGRPCEDNRAEGSMPVEEMWFIDVHGNVRTRLGRPELTRKVVVVNTGCGTRGCGGTIGYASGWPHPLGRSNPRGPGVCPNGYIGQGCQAGSTTACFCYTSIEKALADVPTSTSQIGDCPAPHCPHRAPPFLRLSSAGWEKPPHAGRTRPTTTEGTSTDVDPL